MTMPTTPTPLSFPTRGQWRSWLRKNHAKSSGAWVQLYKKHMNRGLAYADAVEEALCFGWVDGQLRRIDGRRHMLRFTPRRPNSIWARSNITRVKKLMKAKKMTAAGLKLFRTARRERNTAPDASVPRSLSLPHDLRQALVERRIAWQHWQNRPPSARRIAIWWVRSAKKPETRRRRVRNIVSNAARYAKAHY